MHRGKNKRPAHRHNRPSKGKEKQKVGSAPEAAEQIGGKGDFGISASDPAAREQRASASDESKHRNKKLQGRPPRSSLSGTRTAGVGAPDSGPGSSSGGDIDLDITGVGTEGSGIAQNPPVPHVPPQHSERM